MGPGTVVESLHLGHWGVRNLEELGTSDAENLDLGTRALKNLGGYRTRDGELHERERTEERVHTKTNMTRDRKSDERKRMVVKMHSEGKTGRGAVQQGRESDF